MAATASSRVNRSLRTTEPLSKGPESHGPFPLLNVRSPFLRKRAAPGHVNDFNAAVVLSELIAATERLAVFPESGRSVPEFQNPVVGKVIFRRPTGGYFRIGPPRPMVSP